MANNIVKDSLDGMAVKQVQVGDSTMTFAQAKALVGVLVVRGAKAGVVGDIPRQGEDGNWYATVDGRALIRLEGVTGAYTDGAPVYAKASDGTIQAAAGTGIQVIGFADRPKSSTTAGKLFVQLVPGTGA